MKVLVIGASGNIGSGTVKAALLKGYEVVAVCRNKKPIDYDAKVGNIQYEFGNWHDYDFAKRVINKDFFDIIVDGLIFNIREMKRDLSLVNSHCKQFFYISTAGIYEQPAINIDESIIIDKRKLKWAYSKDKKSAEEYLVNNKNRLDFEYTIIRPAFTYGKYRIPVAFVSRENQWTLVKRIINDKPIVFFNERNAKHAVTHISTFSDAVVGLFDNPEGYSKAFHISDDMAYTWDEVINCVAKLLNKEAKIIHLPINKLKYVDYEMFTEISNNKVKDLILDNSGIKAACGDVCYSVPLETGLSETLEYLKDYYSEKQDDELFNTKTDFLILQNLNDISDISEQRVAKAYIDSIGGDELQKLKSEGISLYSGQFSYCVKVGIKKVIKRLLRR